MQPRALIGLGALALAAALTAVLTLRPAAETTAATSPRRSLAAGDRDTGSSPASPPPDASRTLGDALQALGQPREPQMQLPPAQARREAEQSFEHVMGTLEELADAGQRLPAARRDELYRNTNDAFSALSAALDPQNPADMQALEDANIRMKAMLRELGVRVPRRPPIGEP